MTTTEPVHEAPAGLRAALTVRTVGVELAFMLGLAVVLAMIGAFGIFVFGPWPERMVYWARTVLVGYLVHRPLIRLAAGAAVRFGLPEAAGWGAAVLAGAVPMTFWLWWLGPTVDLDRAWPGDAEFLQTYAQVILVGALAWGALWALAGRRETASPATPAERPEAGAPARPVPAEIGARLLERLPVRLGREVIALGMEDHYVRVFTRRGDTLVLMRMADAVADLAAVDGAQVHRSWWVARAAVAAAERRGRGGVLKLDTGLEVPVARRRLAELKALGWA